MTISLLVLEKGGISAIDEMILELSVINAEDWSTLQKDILVSVYPTGKTAEEIKAAERKPVENELVVLDNEYCTFIIEGVNTKHSLGYAVNCYCENKTDSTLRFMLRDEKINDQDASGILVVELLPGTRRHTDAVFMKTGLEKSGINIEEISKIQGTMRVYEGLSNVIAEEAFVYEPKTETGTTGTE